MTTGATAMRVGERAPAATEHLQANKALVRTLCERLDAGDGSVLDEVCAPNVVVRSLAAATGIESVLIGAAAWRQRFEHQRHAVGPRTTALLDVVAEADLVVVRSITTVTPVTSPADPVGLLLGEALSVQRPVRYEGFCLYRIVEGKIVDVRSLDTLPSPLT
jgi:ketosteroid isomerase-like protein